MKIQGCFNYLFGVDLSEWIALDESNISTIIFVPKHMHPILMVGISTKDTITNEDIEDAINL